MKTYSISLAIILAALIFTGCNKDDTEYYSTLGIINITNDSIIIESDEGNRLLVDNRAAIGSAIKDKDRVIANFSLVNEQLPTGIDYIIDIYDIVKVLFKPVIELTPEIADSIGNDELAVSSLWLEKDFINLNFMYYGGQEKHLINLIRYPGEIRTDTVTLEIRHNENDDNGSYYLNGFVSFDVRSLRNDVADSVIICIKAKEFDNRTYKKNVTYKY